MAFNKEYLFEHNIDWFGCINGRWIYASTRGGLLPSRVDDDIMLRKLQAICSSLPDIFNRDDIVINKDFIKTRYNRALDFYGRRFYDDIQLFRDFTEFYTLELFTNNFVNIFLNMAVKGFYTYVRTDLENPFSNDYRLVASPNGEIPATLNETIRNPFNDNIRDKNLTKYIKRITIDNPNLSIENLDGMF